MSNEIEFKLNTATENEVESFLTLCDKFYTPLLSSKVNIREYANKITKNAELFEAWGMDNLVGLVAVYCNNNDKKLSFVTNVSVLQEFQGRQIASRLIDNAISHVKSIGFKSIELSVSSKNFIAIRIYIKKGFSPFSHTQDESVMKMYLQ